MITKVLYYIPGYNFGGIESMFKSLVENNHFSNIEIDLLVEKDVSAADLSNQFNNKINILELPRFQSIYDYTKELTKIFKKNRYDIVHSFDHVRTFPFFLIARQIGIKHRVFHAHTNSLDGNRIKKDITKILILLAKNLATLNLAASSNAGDFIFKNSEYLILPNGTNVEKFKFSSTQRDSIRKKLLINEDSIVIGHVGRFTSAKNYPFIIDIFNSFCRINSDSKLLLVGDGPLKKEIINRIKKLNLEKKVILTGKVSNPDIYYNAMDVFLFPSIYEGFGNVVIEAQASGLPVVLSDNVPQETKVTKDVIFLSLDEKEKKWIETIKKIHDKNKLDRLSKNELVEKSKYNIKNNNLLQMDIYENIDSYERKSKKDEK